MRWHSSESQIRTKGGAAGSELLRLLIALSQAAFSWSLDVQPSGVKLTIEPSLCRQVKRKSITTHPWRCSRPRFGIIRSGSTCVRLVCYCVLKIASTILAKSPQLAMGVVWLANCESCHDLSA